MEIDSHTGKLTEIRKKTKRKNITVTVISIIVLFVAFLIAMVTGAVHISISETMSYLFGHGDQSDVYILQGIRLPRILCCMIVGAGLSVAGVAMQGLFRNPMASPSVLGISSGAAFGASLAIGLGFGTIFGSYSVPALSFIFCFLTVFLVYILAKSQGNVSSIMLLLAGIAVGAFFNGLVSTIQYVSDSSALPSIVYWLMGSFADCRWDAFELAFPTITIGIFLIAICATELNLISLGEEQAENLGVNVKRTRILLLLGTSLAIAGSVSISGIIGFVGLIIPHIFRMLTGPNHKVLIPLSMIGGAIFMVIIDTFSRMIICPEEFPIGIVTAILGAPFFIYVMRTKRNIRMGDD